MSRFIIPFNPAWDMKHFILEMTTSIAEVSIHLKQQQVVVFLDGKIFQIDDSMRAILEVFGFHKTDNTEEWRLETIPNEITFAKAWLLYLGMQLDSYEKEKRTKRECTGNKRKAEDQPPKEKCKTLKRDE